MMEITIRLNVYSSHSDIQKIKENNKLQLQDNIQAVLTLNFELIEVNNEEASNDVIENTIVFLKDYFKPDFPLTIDKKIQENKWSAYIYFDSSQKLVKALTKKTFITRYDVFFKNSYLEWLTSHSCAVSSLKLIEDQQILKTKMARNIFVVISVPIVTAMHNHFPNKLLFVLSYVFLFFIGLMMDDPRGLNKKKSKL